LLLLDLDGFKKINDTKGHSAGDETLVNVAETMTSASKAGDIVARLGGDELAIVAPRTGPEDALKFAKRLQTSLKQDCGVSTGIAVVPIDPFLTIEENVDSADRVLYGAKRSGDGQIATLDNDLSLLIH
jgi:diguanylate cyclase (GGDEF)-like protein